MKKTLIAVAALAATSAFAQVTVYGRMDVGYGSYTAEAGADEAKTSGVSSKGSASSLLGVKGTEDLGGGLKAFFTAEGNMDPANGKLADGFSFDRTSLVGLTGGFGTIALGRDYTPMFKLIGASEINGFSNLTTLNLNDPDGNGTSSPNQIIYNSPNMSGFQFNASLGNTKTTENATEKKVSHNNVTVTYNNGPLMVGAGVGSTKVTDTITPADEVETDGMALVAGYNFGTFSLKGNYISREITEAGLTEEDTEYNIGAVMPMGKVTLSAQVGRNNYEDNAGGDDSGTDVVLGVEYALSAKTALYAKTGTVNKWSDAKEKTTGTAVGIRTVF